MLWRGRRSGNPIATDRRDRVNSASGTSRTLEVTASWDLDLWGKLRRQIESNHAAAQVSEAQLDATLLSAQAELVSDYCQLRYADALQTLLQQTITAYQRTLDITRNQYDAGLDAASDIVTAETQLQASQSQLIAVGLSRARYEHAIALLVGLTPRQLTIPSAPLSAIVPEVPVWVPSELLPNSAP